jgi:long-chain acyl-CoA synthetase
VPVGEEGQVYFGNGNDRTITTRRTRTKPPSTPKHKDWSSLGDVGKLDEDGYLYLTDRKAFMIISGGVNIYPQECENVLITHPKVADVAVIGVPDGVRRVREGRRPAHAGHGPFGARARGGADGVRRRRLSNIKCPKSIDFDPELPRHPTGKLYKRLIRDRYWGKKDSRIV